MEDASTKLGPRIRQVLATSQVDDPAIPSLARAASTLRTRLSGAATVVSKTVPEGPNVKQGRRKWLNGARQLGNGLAQLAAALRDVQRGLTTKARTDSTSR
jgi:hypothetical protein